MDFDRAKDSGKRLAIAAPRLGRRVPSDRKKKNHGPAGAINLQCAQPDETVAIVTESLKP